MTKQYYGVPLERSDYLKLEPHQKSCTPEEFPKWLNALGSEKRLAVDLFSGAGGLSLGLERAGWTVAASVDFDKRALETHAANFPGMSLHMDLGDPTERDRLVSLMEPARIDLVAGGPPCQPFSRAGRSKIRSLVDHHGRDPHDRRKELWIAYLDVVERIRPRAVLMENVPDMGLTDDFVVIRTIEQRLENLGYATQVRLVDAWRYGVPQHRKRLILLARNDVEKFEWRPGLAPEERTNLRDAIGDLPVLPVVPKERIGERELPYSKPSKLSPFARDMRKGAPRGRVWDHMTRRVRKDDWETFADMSSKTLYSELHESRRRYKADHFTDKYKKLGWEDLSRSITAHIAKDGYWYIHPEQHRTLTVREAARVQTFPDRFRFAGTRSDAFRQIGNAVPPMLGEAAAEALLPAGKTQTTGSRLQPRWRGVRKDLTAWAKRQRETDNWHQFPGEHLSPPCAAVIAVLSGTRLKSAQLEKMAVVVRGRDSLTKTAYLTLLDAAPTAAARVRIERLAEAVGETSVWSTPEEVPERLTMKPSESTLYRLLIGVDLLWVGQGALRVAARLSNSESDKVNRLSDGRVELVKLVGAGDDATLRMAALRVIGNSICRPKQPLCSQCPLSTACARRDEVSDDLFSVAPGESY